MTIFLKSQTLAGPSSRHATFMPWPKSLMKNDASASIFIWPNTSCVAMVSTRRKIKLRIIYLWQCSLPCILSKMLQLQRKLLQQSEISACIAQQREQGQVFFQVFMPGCHHWVGNAQCNHSFSGMFLVKSQYWDFSRFIYWQKKCSQNITCSQCPTPAAQRLCKSSAPAAGVLGGWGSPSNWVLDDSNVNCLNSRVQARQ